VLVARGLVRRHRTDHRLELLRGKRIEVRARRSEARQVDGDLIDDGRGFTAQVEPGAVVVRVPRDATGDSTPAHTSATPGEPLP
jgi:diacylglycerol kinase family enzyme